MSCPKCGSKLDRIKFDNGIEYSCERNDYSKYDEPPCDYERWEQNPDHDMKGPERRCLTVTMGRKKLISLRGG